MNYQLGQKVRIAGVDHTRAMSGIGCINCPENAVVEIERQGIHEEFGDYVHVTTDNPNWKHIEKKVIPLCCVYPIVEKLQLWIQDHGVWGMIAVIASTEEKARLLMMEKSLLNYEPNSSVQSYELEEGFFYQNLGDS